MFHSMSERRTMRMPKMAPMHASAMKTMIATWLGFGLGLGLGLGLELGFGFGFGLGLGLGLEFGLA